LVIVNFHDFLRLREGEYDLTTISEIEDPDYRYSLVVLDNGLGFRRSIPRKIPDFSKRIQLPPGVRGNTVELWQPGQIAVISVFSPETWKTKVYDLIRFAPGPSPVV
jgi:hypothetical protein